MKRRNFLLSIPLIGLAVKAIAKPAAPAEPPAWAKKFQSVISNPFRKYPLTEKEAFKESEDGNVLVWDQSEQGFKELKAEIRGRTVIFKKDDDGKFSVMDPDTGSTVKGNLLWTDECEIKLE